MTRSISWAVAAAFFAFAPFAAAQEAPPPPDTPQAWRAAARSDLEALRALIAADTPIVVDDENPRMQAWYDDGYREAQARLRRVRDRSGYFYALSAYINGFRDPHVDLNPVGSLPVARWPGFIATRSGEGSVVHYRDEGDARAPALGARIVSCDGKSLAELEAAAVFGFVLNPRLAADRRSAAPRLFLDRGNVFAPPPRRCVFEHDGARRTLRLDWRDIPEGDEYWTQYNQASVGPGAAFGVSAPTPGVTWIGVPTFGNQAAEQLEALVAEIDANAEAMRNGRAIVIDVRGNGGGNSAWGERVARAVFGDAVIEALPQPDAATATDWRASPANRDYIASFAPQLLEQFGADSEIGQWVVRIRDELGAAVERGEPMWRQREDGETGPIPAGGGLTQHRPQGPSPIPARVYVLSNGTCASACLDFSDIVLQIPGVLLIGADTAADGLLMEVREQQLPSGLATLVLPMKVNRGRARGWMEAYAADVPYDGVWTDEAVRAWVMGLIAAE
jgi:hypothetical protein